MNGLSIESLGGAHRVDSARQTFNFESSIITEFLESEQGSGGFRGEWKHDKSASSAYWDPRGRQIVSTSYDDTLRCMLRLLFFLLSAHRSPSLVWDIESPAFKTNDAFPNFKPFCRMKHNCQTVINGCIYILQWLIFFILG